MWAVPASNGDTPTWYTRPSSGSPFALGRTLVHVFPPSFVTWTLPSSVPNQITFVSVGAMVIDRMVLYVSAPEMSYSTRPPLVTCLVFSLRVTSGLTSDQCVPPSVVLNSTLPPDR